AWIPVLEMLHAYFHLEPDDEPAVARDKVTARLAALDPALTAMRSPPPALGELPVADPRWEGLEPPQRRRHTLEALKSLLLLEARRAPLLLVFEDLHRVDEETQAFLDGLMDRLPPARPPARAGDLPARVPARRGEQAGLRPAPPRPPRRGARAPAARRAAGPGPEPRSPARPAHRAHRGQSSLPGRERARARGDGGAGRRARRVPAHRHAHRGPRAYLGARGARRPHRPPGPHDQAPAPVR